MKRIMTILCALILAMAGSAAALAADTAGMTLAVRGTMKEEGRL